VRKRSLSIFWIVLVLFATRAAAQADFTDTVTFGNSLTHNDLLWIVYGTSRDLYGADPMEAAFDKGAVAGDELTNYAIAGSESGDVSIQIDLYEFLRLLNLQDRATLFGFEIGGNDVLNHLGLLAASPPGVDPAADAVIDAIIDNMRTDLSRLRATHPAAQFVVWLIPDVTVTPDLWGTLTPDEVDNVRAHIDRVNRLVRQAGDRLDFVVALDVYTTIQDVVWNPPILFGHPLVPPPARGAYDDLFADVIHPTAVSNAMIANELILDINAAWNDDIPLYTDEELATLAHIPF